MFEEYDELITIDELCNILCIGRNTAYRLLKSNALQAFKIGRIWKIPKRSVENYICQNANISLH
jgi:excisionase family DNA binding protein